MHRFKEGEEVTVCEEHAELQLRPGDCGTVWCLYNTDPPGYDVTFRGPEGQKYDTFMYEEELAPVPAAARRRQSGRSRPPTAAPVG